MGFLCVAAHHKPSLERRVMKSLKWHTPHIYIHPAARVCQFWCFFWLKKRGTRHDLFFFFTSCVSSVQVSSLQWLLVSGQKHTSSDTQSTPTPPYIEAELPLPWMQPLFMKRKHLWHLGYSVRLCTRGVFTALLTWTPSDATLTAIIACPHSQGVTLCNYIHTLSTSTGGHRAHQHTP